MTFNPHARMKDLDAQFDEPILYYFAIYHLYTRFGKEELLLVSKNRALFGYAAKANYLNEIHPENIGMQDFSDNYLQVEKITEEEFNRLSQDDIDDNRKRIGMFL